MCTGLEPEVIAALAAGGTGAADAGAAALPAAGAGAGTAALFGPTAAQTGLLAAGAGADTIGAASSPLAFGSAAAPVSIPGLAGGTEGASLGAQAHGLLVNALGGGNEGIQRAAMVDRAAGMANRGVGIANQITPVAMASGLLSPPRTPMGGPMQRPQMQDQPMPNIAQRMGGTGVGQAQIPPQLLAMLRARGLI